MGIGSELFLPRIRRQVILTGHLSKLRGNLTCAWEELVKRKRAKQDNKSSPGGACLQLAHMVQVGMGDFMRHDSQQLAIAGPIEQPCSDVKLTPSRIGSVDLAVRQHTNPHLARRQWVVHML